MRSIPRRPLSALVAVLTVTGLFTLAGRAPSADAATTTVPTIRTSADRGFPGGSLLVSVAGFSPGERVDLYVGVRSVAAPTAGSDGSITGYRITVPGVTPLGAVSIVANGSSSRFTAETTWTSQPSPWGQSGGSAAHTQQNAGEFGLRAGTIGALARTDRFDGPYLASQPAVSWDTVYVASLFGTVTAYRPDGTTVWQQPLAVESDAVVVGGGRVYIVTMDGLVALDQATGRRLWTGAAGTGAPSSYADGVLYLGRAADGGAGAAALSASTGTVVWTRPVAAAGKTAAPAVAGGRVFLRLAAGGVAALAAADGTPVWTRTFDATGVRSAAVSGSTVVAASGSGITALAADSGAVLWSHATPVEGAPAVIGNRVVGALLGDDGLYRATGLSLTDGDQLWRTSRVDGSAAASAGLVFFAQYHDLSVIDPVDGDLVAKSRIDIDPEGDYFSTDGLGLPSVSGGAVWVPVARTGRYGGEGNSYGLQRFAVDGLDGVPAVRALDDTETGTGDDRIAYSGGWVAGSRSGAYRGTFHYARSTGAESSVTFNGVGARIWYSQASNFGNPRVFVDGEYVDTLTEYISTGKRDGVKSWSSPLLTRGRHTLVVRSTSTTVINLDRIDLGTS